MPAQVSPALPDTTPVVITPAEPILPVSIIDDMENHGGNTTPGLTSVLLTADTAPVQLPTVTIAFVAPVYSPYLRHLRLAPASAGFPNNS